MGTPQTIQMANLGMADSLILMVMALVVFGPRRLPQIGRQIGKLMYEFRKASNDFKFQMEEELRNAEEADRRKADEARMKALAVTATAPKLSPTEAMAPLLPPETPDPSVSVATAESPYPGEEVYPPAIEAPAEVPAEETYPRIQPPSTGEQVPAARPNNLTALAKADKDEAAKQEAGELANPDAALEAGGAEIAAAEEPSAAEPPAETEQAVPHA